MDQINRFMQQEEIEPLECGRGFQFQFVSVPPPQQQRSFSTDKDNNHWDASDNQNEKESKKFDTLCIESEESDDDGIRKTVILKPFVTHHSKPEILNYNTKLNGPLLMASVGGNNVDHRSSIAQDAPSSSHKNTSVNQLANKNIIKAKTKIQNDLTNIQQEQNATTQKALKNSYASQKIKFVVKKPFLDSGSKEKKPVSVTEVHTTHNQQATPPAINIRHNQIDSGSHQVISSGPVIVNSPGMIAINSPVHHYVVTKSNPKGSNFGIHYPQNQSSMHYPSSPSIMHYPPNQSSIQYPPNQSNIHFPPNQSSIHYPPNQSNILYPSSQSGINYPPHHSSSPSVYTPYKPNILKPVLKVVKMISPMSTNRNHTPNLGFQMVTSKCINRDHSPNLNFKQPFIQAKKTDTLMESSKKIDSIVSSRDSRPFDSKVINDVIVKTEKDETVVSERAEFPEFPHGYSNHNIINGDKNILINNHNEIMQPFYLNFQNHLEKNVVEVHKPPHTTKSLLEVQNPPHTVTGFHNLSSAENAPKNTSVNKFGITKSKVDTCGSILKPKDLHSLMSPKKVIPKNIEKKLKEFDFLNYTSRKQIVSPTTADVRWISSGSRKNMQKRINLKQNPINESTKVARILVTGEDKPLPTNSKNICNKKKVYPGKKAAPVISSNPSTITCSPDNCRFFCFKTDCVSSDDVGCLNLAELGFNHKERSVEKCLKVLESSISYLEHKVKCQSWKLRLLKENGKKHIDPSSSNTLDDDLLLTRKVVILKNGSEEFKKKKKRKFAFTPRKRYSQKTLLCPKEPPLDYRIYSKIMSMKKFHNIRPCYVEIENSYLVENALSLYRKNKRGVIRLTPSEVQKFKDANGSKEWEEKQNQIFINWFNNKRITCYDQFKRSISSKKPILFIRKDNMKELKHYRDFNIIFMASSSEDIPKNKVFLQFTVLGRVKIVDRKVLLEYFKNL